jgi:hypothetical protein
MFSVAAVGSGYLMIKSRTLADKARTEGDYTVTVDRSGMLLSHLVLITYAYRRQVAVSEQLDDNFSSAYTSASGGVLHSSSRQPGVRWLFLSLQTSATSFFPDAQNLFITSIMYTTSAQEEIRPILPSLNRTRTKYSMH